MVIGQWSLVNGEVHHGFEGGGAREHIVQPGGADEVSGLSQLSDVARERIGCAGNVNEVPDLRGTQRFQEARVQTAPRRVQNNRAVFPFGQRG